MIYLITAIMNLLLLMAGYWLGKNRAEQRQKDQAS